MLSPFSLEIYAQDVIRDHHRAAVQADLAAQLAHAPRPRPDLALRQRLATGLRALAIRLDPCLATEPAVVIATQR